MKNMETYKIGDTIYVNDIYSKPTVKATVIDIPSREDHIDHYRLAGYWANLYIVKTEDGEEREVEFPCCCAGIDILAYE